MKMAVILTLWGTLSRDFGQCTQYTLLNPNDSTPGMSKLNWVVFPLLCSYLDLLWGPGNRICRQPFDFFNFLENTGIRVNGSILGFPICNTYYVVIIAQHRRFSWHLSGLCTAPNVKQAKAARSSRHDWHRLCRDRALSDDLRLVHSNGSQTGTPTESDSWTKLEWSDREHYLAKSFRNSNINLETYHSTSSPKKVFNTGLDYLNSPISF